MQLREADESRQCTAWNRRWHAPFGSCRNKSVPVSNCSAVSVLPARPHALPPPCLPDRLWDSATPGAIIRYAHALLPVLFTKRRAWKWQQMGLRDPVTRSAPQRLPYGLPRAGRDHGGYEQPNRAANGIALVPPTTTSPRQS